MRVEVLEGTFFETLVAEEISHAVKDVTESQERCDLVLAGGSTPAAVYRCLSRPPHSNTMPWDKVRLFWGDERFVPDSDQQSNTRMVRETLLTPLSSVGVAVRNFPVITEVASPEIAASQYNTLLKKELNRQDLDIVLLGMGEDGHFASIFPGSPLVSKNDEDLVTVGIHPKSQQPRVTLTFSAIANAGQIYFIVKGAKKAEMLKKVIDGNGSPEQIPCRLFHTLGKKVVWLVDTAAAKLLKK